MRRYKGGEVGAIPGNSLMWKSAGSGIDDLPELRRLDKVLDAASLNSP